MHVHDGAATGWPRLTPAGVVVVLVAEVVAGWRAGSLALLGDAGHGA